MTDEPDLDPALLSQKQTLLQGFVAGAYSAAMTALGIRLQIYAVLAQGAATSDELAQRTGLHERWLREWLHSQVASGVVEHADGRYSITAEIASLLADESSTRFAGGRVMSLPQQLGMLERVEESFRSGVGYTWDDRGRWATETTERARHAWYRDELVPVVRQMEGVEAKLRAGGKVADVGCGTGQALEAIARAFPSARCHGYEISRDALLLANRRRDAAGLANLWFHDAQADPMPPDASCDLVLSFDCLHDMTHPERAAAAIRRAIKPDGTWLIMEIDCLPTFEENLQRGPAGAATSYAISVLSCLASSMSEPGALGYGTNGLPEPALRELVTAAGFPRFRRLDGPQPPLNLLYEARP